MAALEFVPVIGRLVLGGAELASRIPPKTQDQPTLHGAAPQCSL